MKYDWEQLALRSAPRDGSIILVWHKHCGPPAVWTTSDEAGYVGPEVAGYTHWCYIEIPPND